MSEVKKPTPFERFQKAMAKAISVPKKEIDRREKKWKNGKSVKK